MTAPGGGGDEPPVGPAPVLPAPPQPVVVAPAQPYTYPPQTATQAPVAVVTPPAPPAVDPWTNDPGMAQTPAGAVTLANDALARTARAAGEPVVPATQNVVSKPVTPPETRLAGVGEYKAQPGDVLSKIVAKTLGRWTPENKEVFLKLNPKLRSNPDMIVVGETYLVPKDAASAVALREPAKPAPAPAKPAKARTYTVKPGDTLYRIAARVCGDADKQDDLLKLNADQIDDPHQIGVGMTLKLPA